MHIHGNRSSNLLESKPQARRHHYVPQFYLRAWLGSDDKGLWLYIRDKHGHVRAHRRSPKSVGYATDLYTLWAETPYSVLNPCLDAVEQKFFSVIDDAAAAVHRKLLSSGIKSLTGNDRSAWALFLNSLMERHPARIGEIEQSDSPEGVRDEIHRQLGRSDFLGEIDWLSMYRNSIRRALVDHICDDTFVNYISQMRWATASISADEEHLITSDTPVVINGGVSPSPISLLSIAISPKKLLVIHDDDEGVGEGDIRSLAVVHNALVVQQTEKYLISSRELHDGPHTKYVRLVQELMK